LDWDAYILLHSNIKQNSSATIQPFRITSVLLCYMGYPVLIAASGKDVSTVLLLLLAHYWRKHTTKSEHFCYYSVHIKLAGAQLKVRCRLTGSL